MLMKDTKEHKMITSIKAGKKKNKSKPNRLHNHQGSAKWFKLQSLPKKTTFKTNLKKLTVQVKVL